MSTRITRAKWETIRDGLLYEIDRLTKELAESERAIAETERLRGFARKILTQERGCDIDGYAVQEWAVDAGLLIVVPVTEACQEEGCVCVEYGFPMDCYRLSPLLAEGAEHPAPQGARGMRE